METRKDAEMRWVNVLLGLCIVLLVGNILLTYGMSEKMDAHTALLQSISQGVKEPVSTTYTDIAGLVHTVPTPRNPEGNTAHDHQVNLCESFNVFEPQDSQNPAWWTPGMNCSEL